MTTYNTRYLYKFHQVHESYLGEIKPVWRVNFNYPDYDGQVQELLPAGEPLVIECQGMSSNRLIGACPLTFHFEIFCSGEWDPMTLVVKGDQEIQVIIEIDETGVGDSFVIQHLGWIQADTLNIDHTPFPNIVSVLATDGLSSTKDLPISNLDSTPLSGMVSLTQSLRSALHKAGYIAPLVTGFNLYEKGSMTQGQLPDPVVDPLYRTLFSSEALITDEGNIAYAFDVVEQLSAPCTARLGQTKGKWYFVRNDEAGGGKNPFSNTPFTVHTRTYDGIMPSSTSSSHQDESFVLDIGKSGKGKVVFSSPKDMLSLAKKGIRVDQSYGRNINKLPNGDWTNVDNTGLPIGWFRQNIVAANSYRAGTGTDIDPYYMVLVGHGDEKLNPDSPSIYTDILIDQNTVEYQRGAERVLKGQFELSNNVDAVKIGVIAYRKGKGYVLQGAEQGAGGWNNNVAPNDVKAILTYHTTIVNGNPVVNTGKGDIEIRMEALDKVERIRIYVCIGEAMKDKDYSVNPGFVKVYGLRLETASANKDITGTSSRIAPKKIKVDTVASLTLGDVPILGDIAYYKTGTLYRRSSSAPYVPTQLWYEAGDTALANGKQLLDWVAYSYASDQMQPAWSFEGDIVGRFPYAMLQVLRLLDFGEYVNGTSVGPRQLKFLTSGGNNYIEVGASLPWLEVGMTVSISGSASNNKRFTVIGVNSFPSGQWTFQVAESVTGETVSAATLTQVTFTPYLLQLTRWKFSARMAMNSVTAVRIPQTLPAGLPAIDYGWITPNGDVPLGLDQNDLPLNPASQQVISEKTNEIIKGLRTGALPPITARIRPIFPNLVPNNSPITARLLVKNTATNTTIATIPARLRQLASILRLPP